MKLRIFTEPQQGATYDDLLAVAKAAERLGFDAFFRSDHYLRIGRGRPGPRLHRRLDHPGRAGQGDVHDQAGHPGEPGHVPAAGPAGDQRRPGGPDERRPGRAGHRRGLVRRRAHRLRHPVPAVGGAVRPASRSSSRSSRGSGRPRRRSPSTARYYRLVDSPALPKPVQRPNPPIIIGGVGAKRTPRLAAAFADEYNVPFRTLDDTGEAFGRVRQAAEETGRTVEAVGGADRLRRPRPGRARPARGRHRHGSGRAARERPGRQPRRGAGEDRPVRRARRRARLPPGDGPGGPRPPGADRRGGAAARVVTNTMAPLRPAGADLGGAADDLHHRPARHRPRLPAAQASRPGAGVRPVVRHGARLLPRGRRRALHGRAAAGGRPGRAGPVAGQGLARLQPRPVRQRPAVRRLLACWRWRWPTCSAPRGPGGATARPELADAPLPLRDRGCPRCPAGAAPELAERLFEPLGWQVEAQPVPLDERVPRVGRLALRAARR